MATLNRHDAADHITYEVVGFSNPSYRVVIYKEGTFHIEITAAWPISGVSTWEDYAAQIEAGHTVVPA